ncbi:MAG: hypothetical protein ACYTEQ_12635 [Planctomycetota bacterium]|jgi:hypothetical protein
MYGIHRRLDRAEKTLNLRNGQERPVVIEAVVFGGELPQGSPSGAAGKGTVMRYVSYDDIAEEKQWPE